MQFTLKRLAPVMIAVSLAGCGPAETLMNDLDAIGASLVRVERTKMPSKSVEIDGRTYEVRVNEDRFPNSGKVVERWAIVKDGRPISCREASVEACEQALRRQTRDESGGGGY